jgi:hypothetical protein
MLLLFAVLGVLRLLHYEWPWLAFGVVYGAYAVVFYLLPWTVRMGRAFAAGYRSA